MDGRLPAVLAGLLVLAGGALLTLAVLAPRGGLTGFGSPGPSPGSPGPTTLATGIPGRTPGSSSASSPTASPTPRATARVIPATAIDLTWRPVARLGGDAPDPATQTVLVNGLARGPKGYVAVGSIVDGSVGELGATGPVRPALWTSADGTTWSRGDARPFGDAALSDATSNGSVLLVLGQRSSNRLIFRSTDGASWSEAGPAGGQVTGLVAGGAGFVAVGVATQTGDTTVWSSRDGAAWAPVYTSVTGILPTLSASVAADGRILLAGSVTGESGVPKAAALVSADGVHWRRAASDGLPRSMTFDAVGVGADGAWYGAGFDVQAGGIGIWRSSDGLVWTPTSFGDGQRTEQPGDTGSARLVAGFAGRTWVEAYTSCCGDPPQRTLVSGDGRAWERADRGTAVRDGRLVAVRIEAGRMLAAGTRGREGWIWLATPPPADGVELLAQLGPRPAEAVCTSGPTFHLQLTVDRSGRMVRLSVLPLDPNPPVEGFPQIIWPFGWSASPGPPLSILDAQGRTVVHEGDTFTLSNGSISDGTYQVCAVDGTRRIGS